MARTQETQAKAQAKPEVPCTCGCWPRTSSKGDGVEEVESEGEKAEVREDTEGTSNSRQAKTRQKG